MNIVLGATGQVGSRLVDELLHKKQPVRAVVRNETKAQNLKDMGCEAVVADYADEEALKRAFRGGRAVFLLTPENPFSEDFIRDTQAILANYRKAVLSAGISKIVGLSSMGAQHASGTGNLLASYLLEHAFLDIEIEQIFVRPAYYFSNWLGYMDLIQEHGILPTFFPPEMKLPMIAPSDVAKFLADVLISKSSPERVFEITGPQDYSSLDIAAIFEDVVQKSVTVQPVLAQDWEAALSQVGFSKNGVTNLIQMTQAVVDGKTKDEKLHPIRLLTDFKTYLEEHL